MVIYDDDDDDLCSMFVGRWSMIDDRCSKARICEKDELCNTVTNECLCVFDLLCADSKKQHE